MDNSGKYQHSLSSLISSVTLRYAGFTFIYIFIIIYVYFFFLVAQIIRGKWKNSKTVVSLLLLFFFSQDSQRIFPKNKRICSFLILFYFIIYLNLCFTLWSWFSLKKKTGYKFFFNYYIRFLLRNLSKIWFKLMN